MNRVESPSTAAEGAESGLVKTSRDKGEVRLSPTSPTNNYKRLKLGLLATYFAYAILLNSASLMLVQQKAEFGLSDSAASLIPQIPELTILALSFVVASYVERLGYRRAVILSVAGMVVTCSLVPTLNNASSLFVLFAFGGATFLLVKIATYALIGRVTTDPRSHASFLCGLEAVFMGGILFGNVLFFDVLGRNASPGAWMRGFYVLAAIAVIAGWLTWTSPPTREARPTAGRPSYKEIAPTVRLIFTPLVAAFIVSNLLYVLSEQSAVNWFPAYDRTVVHLPISLTVPQMITWLIVAAGLGRCVAALVLRWLHWLTVLLSCLFAVSALVLFIIPMGGSSSTVYCIGHLSAPLAAFVLPLVAFFLAPIYPAINSVALTATNPSSHARMSGLIMFFSAVGGIAGKTITRRVFANYGGESALYLSLVSIGALVISLFYFDRLVERRNVSPIEDPAP